VHELYVVLILCRLFSDALRGLHIRLHIDNTIVIAVINKGTAKGTSGPRMMEYVRHIFWLSARHNFWLTSIYVTSKNNSLADALSRGDLPRFSTLLTEWKLGRNSALKSKSARFYRSAPSGPYGENGRVHYALVGYLVSTQFWSPCQVLFDLLLHI
jgi:hypothetical protein